MSLSSSLLLLPSSSLGVLESCLPACPRGSGHPVWERRASFTWRLGSPKDVGFAEELRTWESGNTHLHLWALVPLAESMGSRATPWSWLEDGCSRWVEGSAPCIFQPRPCPHALEGALKAPVAHVPCVAGWGRKWVWGVGEKMTGSLCPGKVGESHPPANSVVQACESGELSNVHVFPPLMGGQLEEAQCPEADTVTGQE